MKKKNIAIVLAAGKGNRMGSKVHKQYLLLQGKPVLCYCLDVFEHSFMDEVILVVGKGEREYCEKEIVEKYGYKKISKIVEGGKERYHSVFCGIKAIGEAENVYIHDGARPFITDELLVRLKKEVEISKACVAAVPVIDTIKVADADEKVIKTLDRNVLWSVQTPQVFESSLVKKAYENLFEEESNGKKISVTDDCMVVDNYTEVRSKLVYSSYKNIKITTTEDLVIAKSFILENRCK